MERAHRGVYCAQRDLLKRLCVTGAINYEMANAWVTDMQREMEAHIQAVHDPRWQRDW